MNQLGKFNGVLLVSDFDDTLYGEDMRITRENVEALTYFTREGGTFTVATGRARPRPPPGRRTRSCPRTRLTRSKRSTPSSWSTKRTAPP